MSFNIAPRVIRSIPSFILAVSSTVIDMHWVPDIRHIPALQELTFLVEGDETCAWNLQGSLVTPRLSLAGEWAVVISEFYRWNHRALTQRGLRDLIVQPHYFKESNAQGHWVTCSRWLYRTIIEPRLEPSSFDFRPGTLKIRSPFS